MFFFLNHACLNNSRRPTYHGTSRQGYCMAGVKAHLCTRHILDPNGFPSGWNSLCHEEGPWPACHMSFLRTEKLAVELACSFTLIVFRHSSCGNDCAMQTFAKPRNISNSTRYLAPGIACSFVGITAIPAFVLFGSIAHPCEEFQSACIQRLSIRSIISSLAPELQLSARPCADGWESRSVA